MSTAYQLGLIITAALEYYIREELEYIPSWLRLYQILLLIILRECLHQNAVIQGAYTSPRGIVYSTTSNYTYFSVNPIGTQWTAATTRPRLTTLTKGLYANAEFMLIGGNMKSVSTDGGQNWTTSTLGAYTLTDLIYVDSNWYAIGSNEAKRFLLQNTASTFNQSNKILDLPDYSRQVIKINV